MSRAFPYFDATTSTVSNSGISTEAINQYLLMSLGSKYHPITLTHIAIDTTDVDSFFPDIDAFEFQQNITDPSKLLYRGIVNNMLLGRYNGASLLLEHLVATYKWSHVAESGIMLLPFIDRLLGGGMAVYYYTLPQFPRPILYFTYAHAFALQGAFAEAIHYFELVINDPPDDITQLLAELDQAHAYYALYFGGTRGLPEVATHRPKSASELRAIQEDIYDRLYALGSDVEGEGEIVPLIERYSVTNYPNPFNPETTIVFEIPHSLSSVMQRESVTTHVRIDIYNVKGQRVKSLVNGDFPSGSHTATWDGKDSSGREVASGVYLYMMQTPDWATTKKMLLLK
jgi:tetratricopeptide (TPR) repeat protein